MSCGECIACSDCTCHTAVLSSVKRECSSFLSRLHVQCSLVLSWRHVQCFNVARKIPKPKKERVERMFAPNVFGPEGTVPKFPICRNVAD